MKILFVSQVPDSRLLGVPRVLYCVGDILKARGHTVDYFYENDGPRPWFSRMALLEWAIRSAPQVAQRCRKEQYDAIVVTTASGWCLSMFRRWLLPPHVKIVSSHHGWEELMWDQMLLEEQQPGGEKFSARFKIYYGGLILWALRQSLKTQDGFVFTSSEERDHVMKKYPAVADKCFFIPNGVTQNYLYPQRFDRPPASGPVRLLFVGYWDPWRKGKKNLIEAFSLLQEKYPEIGLTLAGTKLGEEAILPGFPEECRANVSVVPQADEAALIALYRSHDIFVLPSLFEGMPLVLLEAMASGMPCVTTANNGMKDVVESGKNGILVPRRNTGALVTALFALIADPGLRHRLGQAAQKTIREQYLWEPVALQWESVLAGIVGKPA